MAGYVEPDVLPDREDPGADSPQDRERMSD